MLRIILGIATTSSVATVSVQRFLHSHITSFKIEVLLSSCLNFNSNFSYNWLVLLFPNVPTAATTMGLPAVAESAKHPVMWNLGWLHSLTLATFFILFISSTLSLIAIWRLSVIDGGFVVLVGSSQYTWT